MSKVSSVKKQAEKDAFEYAAAYMSYGEGAGTRRKLIEGTVGYKIATIPGYRAEFEKASMAQNMDKHAVSAKRTHRRRETNAALTRNTRAIATGKYENVNTGLLAAGAIAVVLHKTGADKKIIEAGKKKYKELRQRFRKCDIPEPTKKADGDDKVHKITDVD